MNFPIPDFVPVPSAEIMQTISIISLIIGICLVGVGLLFYQRPKGLALTAQFDFSFLFELYLRIFAIYIRNTNNSTTGS